MESFENTRIWQSAILLSKQVYEIIRLLPPEEKYAISDQLRRSVTSILTNFAEGYGRRSKDDKANRYTIARGECSEVLGLLLLCRAVHSIPQKQIDAAVETNKGVGCMLTGFIKAQYNK